MSKDVRLGSLDAVDKNLSSCYDEGMKKQMYYTQEILFQTNLFGKDYFWMKDVDGTIYLAKAVESVTGVSVNGQTGASEPVLGGLVPDLT